MTPTQCAHPPSRTSEGGSHGPWPGERRCVGRDRLARRRGRRISGPRCSLQGRPRPRERREIKFSWTLVKDQLRELPVHPREVERQATSVAAERREPLCTRRRLRPSFAKWPVPPREDYFRARFEAAKPRESAGQPREAAGSTSRG